MDKYGKPRMVHSNLGSGTSVPSATLGAVQNGALGPPYSQVCSSTSFVSSELSNPTDTSLPKPSQALPEISSQSSPAASDSASPSTPIKGDETKPFSLQFGTTSPGIVNGLQVQHNSLSAGPTQPIPSIPKKLPPQPRNEEPASNFNGGESRPPIQQVKKEVQVAHQMLNIIQQVKDINIDNAPIQQVKRMQIAHQMQHIIQQVKGLNIDNAVTLAGVVLQIYDKALMEPTFCELYANFCFHLSYVLPDFMENGEKFNFKRLLVNKCQEEFERAPDQQLCISNYLHRFVCQGFQISIRLKQPFKAKRVEDEGEIKQADEGREEKRIKARRRKLGNIRLIGELYKTKMLTERIMHECIQKLLGELQTPDEEDLEALCMLMSTIGYQIDHAKARNFMDSYFESMVKLSTNNNLSSRIRFMLGDVIDLRKNRWQQWRKVEESKKTEEVHRDAAQEKQSQTSRLKCGPIEQGLSSWAGSIVKSDHFANAVQRCYDLLAPIIAVQRWELMLIFRNEPSNLDIVEILGDEDVGEFMMYELDLLRRRRL